MNVQINLDFNIYFRLLESLGECCVLPVSSGDVFIYFVGDVIHAVACGSAFFVLRQASVNVGTQFHKGSNLLFFCVKKLLHRLLGGETITADAPLLWIVT